MLFQIRQNLAVKFLWGILALHFLNVSIDTPDRNPEYISENLSINDQESIIELIVEKVIGIENAFAEYDDTDHEEHTKKSNVKLEWVSSNFLDFSIQVIEVIESPLLASYHLPLLSGYSKRISPPPKA